MTNMKKYLETKEERIGKSKWNESNNEECSVLEYIYGINWNYFDKMSLVDVMQGYADEYLEEDKTAYFWLYCPMDEIKEWLATKYLMELGYVECEADFLALFSVIIDEADVFDLDGCFDVALDSLDYTKKTCGVGNGLSLYKDGVVLLH